jgi:Na+-transporting NADH:ubiquinone oxidoreductase subunit C
MNKNSFGYILGFMLMLCILFGTGVSVVHYSTQEMLEKNVEMHTNKILSRAFMIAPETHDAYGYRKAVENNLERDTISTDNRQWKIYRFPSKARIGFEFTGMGFWDRITGILVMSDDLQTIENIGIIEQKETPGLGARIEEKQFTDQFKDVPVDWDTPESERVVIAQPGQQSGENTVDAITGATQTSMALMDILNSELAAFHTMVEKMGIARGVLTQD